MKNALNFQKLTRQRENKVSEEDQQLKQKFALLKCFAQAMEKLQKKHTKGKTANSFE